jgi:hypothetical protein
MILPSGAYCVIRAKYVSATKDHPNEQGQHVEVPAPLQPGDHHWVTLIAEYWDSEADFLAKKPSVLLLDASFGHRQILQQSETVATVVQKKLDSHYVGGDRGSHHLHPGRAAKCDDVLGLLNHPHIQALQVTP